MGFVSHFPPTALDCMESDASTHQILIKINVFGRCKFNFIFTSNYLSENHRFQKDLTVLLV